MEIKPPRFKSHSVKQLQNRLKVLKILIGKFSVSNLKQNDIKFLYYHLKRILTSLYLLLYCETISFENKKYTKTYIKLLFKQTTKVIYKSSFTNYANWKLVYRHGLVDIDSRALIKKISSILAFSRT